MRLPTLPLGAAAWMLMTAVWISFRLLWHDSVPSAARLPLTLMLILCSQSVVLLRTQLKTAPHLPFAVLYAWGALSAWYMVLTGCVLLRDAVLLVLSAIQQDSPLAGILLSVPAELCLIAVSLAAAAFCLKRAQRMPAVRHVPIQLPDLPPALEGLRLVHLSDLHIGSAFSDRWLARVTALIPPLHPDFILISGDLADGSPQKSGTTLEPLRTLHARCGVLLCPGNHDYASGLPEWEALWQSWGIHVLRNRHAAFCLHGENIVIAGVTDPCAPHFKDDMPRPDQALRGAPAGLRIMLAHRPSLAEQSAALGCQVQLSGHTHGGQLFFLFPLVSRMNHGFRSGLYTVQGMKLHVSPGAGAWGYMPLRCGAPAEITVITLHASAR